MDVLVVQKLISAMLKDNPQGSVADTYKYTKTLKLLGAYIMEHKQLFCYKYDINFIL